MKTKRWVLALLLGIVMSGCFGCCGAGAGLGFQVGDRGTKFIDRPEHGPGFAREIDQPVTATIVSATF